jgi:LPXTG-site transpeptidase (sortase) family protein
MLNPRRANPATVIVRVMFVGVLLGVGFWVYDNFSTWTGADAPTATPADVLSVTPTGAGMAAAPTSALPEANPSGATVTPTTLLSAPLLAPVTPTTLFIPTLGVNAPVIQVYLNGESWDISQLGMNIGHLQGTAWLDQPGNIALSGHVEMRDGRQGIFANLGTLQVGDLVILRRGDEERRYAVREIKTTSPDDLSVLYSTSSEQLTLITCDEYDFLQNAYLERVVVVADRSA